MRDMDAGPSEAGEFPQQHISLFLAGDVMTARGIDQVLPYSVDPTIYESYVRNAGDYVFLAERASGPIPERVDFDYVWGAALDELSRMDPDLRIINLETSVTTHDEPAPKGINYRMHPQNVPVLTAARIDCCVLGNNHVLDWGVPGLEETLDVLEEAGLRTAGAGRDRERARAPAVLDLGERGRVLVFSFALRTSGVPRSWAATADRPGVFFVPKASRRSARDLVPLIRRVRREGDIVIASVHWGGNWGYEVSRGEIEFAHTLVDEAGVNVVHGHSSHHPKAIEVYRGAPILYGCGDFLNDYEGIAGHEEYRGDLPLMYFVALGRGGKLERLTMTPLTICRFRLQPASAADASWSRQMLDRECGRFGGKVVQRPDHRLELEWTGRS